MALPKSVGLLLGSLQPPMQCAGGWAEKSSIGPSAHNPKDPKTQTSPQTKVSNWNRRLRNFLEPATQCSGCDELGFVLMCSVQSLYGSDHAKVIRNSDLLLTYRTTATSRKAAELILIKNRLCKATSNVRLTSCWTYAGVLHVNSRQPSS